MKKTLIGLLILLSAVSMAAVLDLTQDPILGTNIFTNNQYGEISITGTIKSEVPQIKYVVYAGNSESEVQDVLILPLFIIQTDKTQSNLGFLELSPKIFVRRISENNQIIPLEKEDKVLFKLEVDNYYSDINSQPWIKKGEEILVTPLGLISAKDRNSLKRKLASDSIINVNGTIESLTQGKYAPSTIIKFKNESEGELYVQNQINLEGSYGQGMIVQEYFASEKELSSNLKILVKIQ